MVGHVAERRGSATIAIEPSLADAAYVSIVKFAGLHSSERDFAW